MEQIRYLQDAGHEDREIFLLDTLMFACDARESARNTGSAVLLFLADVLVKRAREELADHPAALLLDS